MALTEIDRNLLKRCIDRAPGAWNDFVDRFMGLFTHVIHHTAHTRSVRLTPEDIDDLRAEIFVQLVTNDFAVLRRFQATSSLATYLTVVSRRIVVRAIETRRYAEAFGHVAAHQASLDEAHATRATPSDQQRIEDRELVRQMLDHLGPVERQVVQQYHLDGKSYSEISRELDIPQNSIGSILSRARARLRKQHADS